MRVPNIFKRGEAFAHANAPAILTAVGVTGALTAAYLAGTASFRAAEIIDNKQFSIDHDSDLTHPYTLTLQDKFSLVWPEYIPAAGTLCLTVGAILLSNRVSSRRAAAFASAYSVSEKAFEQYRAKVVEHMGEKKERVVRDEIAQDNFDRCMDESKELLVIGDGEVLCHDAYSDRYFKYTMEGLKKAMNDTVYQIQSVEGFASVNDFYARTPLNESQQGDVMGWRSERPLDLIFTTVMSPDQRPAISFTFSPFPSPKYYREH